jgi:two-component system, OmpR family, response regulator RegX3
MTEPKKHTILLVEDDDSLVTAITKKLKLNNFDVVVAPSVDEALKLLDTTKPLHAVWLDHYLFGQKSGLDLVATLKTRADWRHIPVYVVSNTASDDKIQSYIKLGVAKYYIKSDHQMSEIISEIQAELHKNSSDS